MQLAFPYRIDGRDRTAESSEAAHLRELIEQVLFTNPGERVNRPDFGAGVLRLVFGPASPEAAATASFMMRGALQQTLGRRIVVEDVVARAEEASLHITVIYRPLRTGTPERADFTLEAG
jgi:phage baseplate assembly protein W